MPVFGNPNIGPAGNVNNLSESSSVMSAGQSLLYSLAGAVATIGVEKLAQAAGTNAVPTGNRDNPVQVLPTAQATQQQTNAAIISTQVQQQQQAQRNQVLVLGGAALLVIVGLLFAAKEARR